MHNFTHAWCEKQHCSGCTFQAGLRSFRQKYMHPETICCTSTMYQMYFVSCDKWLWYSCYLQTCRGLASSTVSLTGNLDRGDDIKHYGYYRLWCFLHYIDMQRIQSCGIFLNVCIIIIIISLFQEDNMFGTNASLTYVYSLARCWLKCMLLFTVDFA